jgi:hypothetical protein
VHAAQIGAQIAHLIRELEEAIVRDHALDARDARIDIRELALQHRILFGRRCAAREREKRNAGNRGSETPHGP